MSPSLKVYLSRPAVWLLIYNISKKLMADDMPVPSFGLRGMHPLQTIGADARPNWRGQPARGEPDLGAAR
jgi:hypothetical protein